MSTKLLDLVNITKSYDGVTILDDLNLYIRENEFLTLLGPSGCGKTTTLRILGGFETPDAGKVLFNGQDITQLPPNKRQLNTVFQKYALFTHMTIAENIAFGLKIKRKSKAYIDDKIKYALKLVNLEGYENRSPALLSGGQQQRIAIARAIVNEPKVLLLDEPLGALDLKLRQDMQYELIRLKNELGITFVYVTHDQEEALTMSDTIVVMNQGYIQQIGTPEDIYNEPQNAFVADFIGDSNILDGIMIDEPPRRDSRREIRVRRCRIRQKQAGRCCNPSGGYRPRKTGGRHNPWTCDAPDLQRRPLRDGSRRQRLRTSRSLHRSVPGRTGSRHSRRSVRYPDYEQTGIRR